MVARLTKAQEEEISYRAGKNFFIYAGISLVLFLWFVLSARAHYQETQQSIAARGVRVVAVSWTTGTTIFGIGASMFLAACVGLFASMITVNLADPSVDPHFWSIPVHNN